jgi:hypothetical protein
VCELTLAARRTAGLRIARLDTPEVLAARRSRRQPVEEITKSADAGRRSSAPAASSLNLPPTRLGHRQVVMDQFDSANSAALVTSLLLLISMLWLRRRQGQSPRPRADARLDTVQAWPAQLVRVMKPVQRSAYELLRQALPGHLILVQTPLAQFMRVSTRYSYTEWYKRAGRLRTSFLVCDPQSNVIAAVDLRLSRETEREQARHLRAVRVLEAVGLPVLIWTESALPDLAQVRLRFAALLSERAPPATAGEAEGFEPRRHMSGSFESMSVESTDFAALDTAPAPLDEGGGSTHAGRSPRLA